MSEPLSSYLRAHFPSSFHRATTPPFLIAAASGTLSKKTLSQWLAQDRLYAQSYIRFIGLLLSKVNPPPRNPDPSKPRVPSTEARIFHVLTDALVNIRRELGFFEDTAVAYGLDLTAVPDQEEGEEGGKEGWKIFGPGFITKAYIDLFMAAGSSGTSLLEGLTVLWATEWCYLSAWRFASSHLREKDASEDSDGGALRKEFIPNWSSAEFEEFVVSIRDVMDELAGELKGAEEIERERGKCLGWWRQVLWLEERFWPDVKQ
ncbi:transcription regulator PAB1642, putative [Paecilomyces variotii No. 5]|uniref:Transcription regulator PAB1642, putative n=1 Tax=Byssochlamys spectabilis (strain No. 5 / NBRC 109023) TaxID=1356009 RepID=V5FG97_BYSSN|nr:transcription regulator PAB1642, putative [Paecilomyces variotii No. 5]